MTCPSDAATRRNSIQQYDTILLYVEDIAGPDAVHDDLVLFLVTQVAYLRKMGVLRSEK